MSALGTAFKRTPYQTFAALLVLFFSLFLIAIIINSVSFMYGLLNYVETRPQVTVYFQNTANESQIFALRDDLMKSGKVASIKYISKQEAFKIYKDLTKDNPLLIEMTSASILPASLEIYAKEPAYLPQIADYLKGKPAVDEVQFQKIIVDRLLSLTTAVKFATLVMVSFLVLMATIVIVATTSFKIALRKDEIEILQLLGASRFYIIKPFLSEGFMIGLISAVLACLVLGGVSFALGGPLSAYLRGIPAIQLHLPIGALTVWPFNPVFFAITFGITAAFGITIGLIANLLASRKYLS